MLALGRQLGQLGQLGRSLQPERALPLLLSTLQQLRQAQEDRPYSSARRQAAAAAEVTGGSALTDEPEPVLRVPDLSTISALNPRLHEIILQHQALQKSASAVDTMLAALQAASPAIKQPQRLNKTAFRALRVDQLRGLLEQLGADTRGTKEVLVQRLLDIGSGEQERQQEQHAAAVSRAGAAMKEGVVSRRQIAAQAVVAERLAAAAERGGYGVPEASLRESHRQMVQQSGYAQIFRPQEVADILAEARADDVAIIDVRGRCAFTDYMVLATARSQRLVRMLAAAVLHQLKARAREVAPGVAPTVEGALDDSEWLVVDAGSVVAHVFLEGYREEYALEELWAPDGSNIQRVAPKQTVHTLDSLQ